MDKVLVRQPHRRRELGARLFRHLLNLPLGYFRARAGG